MHLLLQAAALAKSPGLDVEACHNPMYCFLNVLCKVQDGQVSPSSAKQAAGKLPQLQCVAQQLAILARCLIFRQLLCKVCSQLRHHSFQGTDPHCHRHHKLHGRGYVTV